MLDEGVEDEDGMLEVGEVGVGVEDGLTGIEGVVVKLVDTTEDEGTDPTLEPPVVEVELAGGVLDPVGVPAELPPSDADPVPVVVVEEPANVEDPEALPEVELLPEPEPPVIPLRVKVPDQPW